jgi:hypothetical protein
MKLVTPPLLSLLVVLTACGDPTTTPQAEVKPADVEAGADAKATGAGAPDVKAGADAKAPDIAAPEAQPAEVKTIADATAPDATAPEATPPAPAVEPAVAADAKPPPGAVTPGEGFYWAEVAKGASRTAIDVIDTSGEEVAALEQASEGGDGIERALSATAKLPAGFAIGDPWAVATTAGAKRGKAVAFGAYTGASEAHFIVVIDTVADGLAARPGTWPGKVPKLIKARQVDTASGPGQQLVEAIMAPIVAASEPAARRALGRKPLEAKHLTVFEGRFPGGFTHLVALVRPLARKDDVTANHVGGLLLADATGKVESVVRPKLTIDSEEVLYLLDLEGDGIDEVIYDSSYYEGSFRKLLSWDAARKPVLRTLGGDGA